MPILIPRGRKPSKRLTSAALACYEPQLRTVHLLRSRRLPSQYETIVSELKSGNGATTHELRRSLAAAAFEHTAQYDRTIADYFANQSDADEESSEFPASLTLSLERKATLRYGENPHQTAAVYRHRQVLGGANLLTAKQLNGKELSYNNLLDADAALAIARSLPACGVSVIKHSNPCGAASADSIDEATEKAMAGDPVSAFGSILGFNHEVDAASAEYLASPGLFVEAIVAPAFSPDALQDSDDEAEMESECAAAGSGTIRSTRSRHPLSLH